MDVSSFRVVRLNAELFPITEFEREKYDAWNIKPVECEVQSSAELAGVVSGADAVMVVSEQPMQTVLATGPTSLIELHAATRSEEIVELAAEPRCSSSGVATTSATSRQPNAPGARVPVVRERLSPRPLWEAIPVRL